MKIDKTDQPLSQVVKKKKKERRYNYPNKKGRSDLTYDSTSDKG